MGDVDNFLKSVLSIEIYFITFITYFYQIPLRKKKVARICFASNMS